MKRLYWMKKIDEDGTRRGLKYPKRGWVSDPDWKPTHLCGHGLHVFVGGEGDGDLLLGDVFTWGWAYDEEGIDLNGKWKFPRLYVVGRGNAAEMTAYLRKHGCSGAIICCVESGGEWSVLTGGYGCTLTGGDGSALVGGDWSILNGGDCSALTCGRFSTLAGGYRATLTGGYRSTLTGGDRSTLTGGDISTLTGGDDSTLTGGYRSTLTGGARSGLLWRFWDNHRLVAVTATVGKDGIKPNTPYTLDEDMKVVEVCAQINKEEL